ncbi:MAG: ATP-binding cassette domain-containing protein, partial [Candidatus Eremiobacteraeota bacterium]|nr:ATP-binding cassette domain-containing protein [Candidatus Eremiobacteraeota bacterium]
MPSNRSSSKPLPAAALELRGVGKVYPGGVRAVDGVDLVLEPGEIHALCGENGAGKSTLAQIASGKLTPSSGSVAGAERVGLVHQHFELVDRLRVWENV